MIVFGTPATWKPKYGPSAHLISTLPGEAGSKELRDFAKKIGLNTAWIQKPGTIHEHFDIFKSRIEKALQAGAKQIDRQELVKIFNEKRKVASSNLAIDYFFVEVGLK